ncbi:Glycosyltransferase involved in cell wall bisynthesis [Abditibacterium utsteinense]|uniref:Glycosyltransferase involved in cell wall bisynthesis n=1 Tax=Abditibacterium utsteinense TaxID=1960156 RepID=A0A2S8SPJ6_9BACT|nr:glycosyltransferase [Abditibacterium utsteinense]PQV62725.1 Glycosyltransferase involved in cell wall bisynthesis [Abditibacterium utsteinense]
MLSISVVIPTLNEAARLPALLEKLAIQTLTAQEIWVCDGNSSDQTAQIARDFQSRLPSVRLIECERGTARQRNCGARRAGAELLVFLDADDAPPPDFLWNVARSYQKIPFSIACPWFVARDAGLFVRAIYLGFNLSFWLSQSTFRMGSGVCLICPREKFLTCGGFDESLYLGEDIHLIRKLCPRHGLHRHLLIPLETSGRRFHTDGSLRLLGFYTLISPLILLGLWKPLQKMKYRAAPYHKNP